MWCVTIAVTIIIMMHKVLQYFPQCVLLAQRVCQSEVDIIVEGR